MLSISVLMYGCTSCVYSKDLFGYAFGQSDTGAGDQLDLPSVYMRPFKPHHTSACLIKFANSRVASTSSFALLLLLNESGRVPNGLTRRRENRCRDDDKVIIIIMTTMARIMARVQSEAKDYTKSKTPVPSIAVHNLRPGLMRW